ncbi:MULTISPECIES: hypothetical protein [Asticcacaulis]|uniref:hypothetical protein n=1 Tax=Asticcacaulis TaxID=76890 RepID=UPI001AE37327|nr:MULTISPECIES: hypothetical protein [Asticcacaulis]MBP2158537.1 hypothetical protein [Asticcacaulis solisilvae]MDR6799583.1 hypothetical protein [Asticcacaulis sp. BE141]
MSNDSLRDLLADDHAAVVPARDYGFELDVMARIERRRFQEQVLVLGVIGMAVSAMLAIVMPHLTPALIGLGQDIVPAAFAATIAAVLLFGFQQMRPGMRAMGLPV